MRLSISTVYIGLTLFCFDFSTTSPIEDHAVQTSNEVLDVNDVLQALKNDSSFDSLVCAVESVILIDGLVLVVSASPDPSLIIPNLSFSHLTHPMSLKASIYQKRWENNKKTKNELLQEEKKRLDERRKEFEANEEKIANFTALIQNVELKTMDLEKVITFIAEALQYLTVLHEKWSHLTTFFKKLTTAIEKNIVVNADNIKDITTDKVFRQRQNRGLLVQIASQAQEIVDIANKYNRLCHIHVNPLLKELSNSPALDPEAVNLRKSTIGDRLSKVRSEVQRSFYQPTGDKATIYIEEKMKNEEKAMKLLYNDEL